MEKKRNILLIHKVLSNQASAKERLVYELWLNSDPANKKLAEQISFVWAIGGKKELSFNSLDKQRSKDRLFSKIKEIENNKKMLKIEKKTVRVLNINKMMSIAAVFVFLIGSIFVANKYLNNSITYSSNGELSMVELPDHSNIWLDKGASIELDSKFNNGDRNLTLKGNAFFNIAKDPNSPFEIEINNLRIKVLGTSFQVYTNNKGNTCVNVYSGVVEFKDKYDHLIVLNQDEGGEFDEETNSFKVIDKSYFITTSKYNSLSFRNSTLTHVFSTLRNYFEVEIIIFCNEVNTMDGYTSPQHGENIDYYFKTIEKLYNVDIEKIKDKSYKVSCK